jgi:hypothetical protein
MKAVRLHSRSGPEQLVYEDAPLPERKQPSAITPADVKKGE